MKYPRATVDCSVMLLSFQPHLATVPTNLVTLRFWVIKLTICCHLKWHRIVITSIIEIKNIYATNMAYRDFNPSISQVRRSCEPYKYQTDTCCWCLIISVSCDPSPSFIYPTLSLHKRISEDIHILLYACVGNPEHLCAVLCGLTGSVLCDKWLTDINPMHLSPSEGWLGVCVCVSMYKCVHLYPQWGHSTLWVYWSSIWIWRAQCWTGVLLCPVP